MIFHILKKDQWQQAVRRGVYEPASLRTEGFIHCSTREQTPGTAQRFFSGQTDLVLLRIDPRRLTAGVRFEAPADPRDERARELFPHVHGPINLQAVIDAIDFPCDDAGVFRLPPGM